MGSISRSPMRDTNVALDFDVLIIGAGLSGIYALHSMRQLGLRARVLEAGGAEGGTWYWNRYPGARFDSESYSYQFSFSKEILDEWNWTEHFAPQTETLKYAQFVTDKLDLRRDMQFNTSVKSAHWQDDTCSWRLTDEIGHQYTSRFLITCMGILNQFTYPNIPGVHNFKGEAFHTARWPEHASVDGKRVGIIGTGATGIQTIQEIAKTVGSLKVFQRTPNWTGPLRNASITLEEMGEIRKRYPEIFEACAASYSCFMHRPEPRRMYDLTREEREALWEDLYAKPGFAKVMSNFRDTAYNQKANDEYSNWVANKIRQRVNDPVVAEKLIPRNHGFGTKRLPLETFYYEVFNQDNVELVDLQEDPIEKITETGVQTASKHIDLDVLIYATGFDAVTGAFTAVDFQGVDGVKLKDVWSEGPRTQLGLTVHGFPNMMMSMGPHQMFGNIPRSIEYAVGWIADCIKYCIENHINRIEATKDGVERWTEHVHNCATGLLANNVDSWMTGVNKNVAHKQNRIIARYQGSAPGYRKLASDAAARNYEDFSLAYEK